MIKLVPVATVMASNLGVRPPPVIDASDSDSTSYWAARLNVPTDRLLTAIDAVGGSVAAVRRYLGT